MGQEKTKKYQFLLIRRSVVIPSVLVVVLALFFLTQQDVLFTPRVAGASHTSSHGASLDAAVEVEFSRPVDRQQLLPLITPEVDGEWRYDGAQIGKHLYKRIRFVPTHTWLPETEYAVDLAGIQSPFGLGETNTYAFSFTTPALPNVASVSPTDGAPMVAPGSAITIGLDAPNPGFAEFEFLLNPKTAFTQTLSEDKTEYVLTPTDRLRQGTEYAFRVLRTGVSRDLKTDAIVHRADEEEVYTGTFLTAPPPEALHVQPTGNQVLVDEDVIIAFTDQLNTESAREHFSITPDVEGVVQFSDNDRIVTFRPTDALAYGTTYTVTMAAGTRTASDGFLPEDVTYAFTTIGSVAVSRTSPAQGNTGVGIDTGVSVTFNQEVDRTSAERNFTLQPGVTGTITWEGNTLNFRPNRQLAYDFTYELKIAAGVKSIYGLDMSDDAIVRFATEPETVKLAIGVDYQDRPLSCEAAALKMALAGKGVYVTESQIMEYVGYDPTPHKGNTWGDPYEAYVGDIDGHQNTTGYGVYWDPIARAGNVWREAEAFTGWSTTDLTREISAGNPVVIWGIYPGGYEDSWYTPDGKYIYAWKGEHVRTAVGFVGSVDNPTQIIINDPVAGQLYWSRERFEGDWGTFGNAGVVIR